MSLVGWVATEDVPSLWADAPSVEEGLEPLLQAAFELCVAYAPSVTPTPLPERYRRAQVAQAKAMWEASWAGANDSIGPEGFAVPVWPMDWHVKNLLRPKRGVPTVG